MNAITKTAAALGVVAVLTIGALATGGVSSTVDDASAGATLATSAASAPAASGTSGPALAPAAGPSGSSTLATTEVVVYKSPTCGCCSLWVDHLRANGFTVVARDTSDMAAIKRRLGVPAAMESCHTSIVDGYIVEGHVPAADVERLLSARPAVVGIAVPGMPMGSPGMEGPRSDRYDVLTFDRAGRSTVFSSH